MEVEAKSCLLLLLWSSPYPTPLLVVVVGFNIAPVEVAPSCLLPLPLLLLLAAADMDEKLRRMLGAVWLLRSMHLNTETYKNTEDYRNAENYRKIRPGSWSSVASSRYTETGESVLRQENFKGAGK